MKKVLFVFSLIIIFASKSNAQSGIQITAFPGFLAPHSLHIPNMAAHTLGAELSFKVKGSGNIYRDSLLKDFSWGASLYFNYLGKPDINGNVIAVIPYFQSRLRKHKSSETFIRIGTGLGYFNKIFDAQTNLKNRAMSNHINGAIHISFLNYRPISESYSLFYGFGLTHFSNGNYSRPNLGINTPQINLGLLINNDNFKIKNVDTNRLYKTSYLETRLGFARKSGSVTDYKKFTVYSARFLYASGITPLRRFRAGIDLFYDKLNPYIFFGTDEQNKYSFKDAFEAAVIIGHEYDFGKVSVHSDLGVYLYKPKEVGKLPYYISIGVNYHILDFSLGTRLKTHAANADLVDWSAGYRYMLNNKK